MYIEKFPDDFLLGTSTASLQIEGGDINNTWYKWCCSGHIKDNSSCHIANDHWNRTSEDIELLRFLNVSTHRISIEWSRIEPVHGTFSIEAISHYRQEISDMKILIEEGILGGKLGGYDINVVRKPNKIVQIGREHDL